MHVVDAMAALLGLLDEFPIVALGELHGVEQGACFVEGLVRHPRFATRPTAIVVEFGNARYQDICDAYVMAGDDVPLSELRRIWCDFAGGGPWGFRAPIYPRFFATVREVNRGLPAERRIRILLGDPPIDWSTLHATAELDRELESRDLHNASVAKAALDDGRRVMVLAGTYHLMKQGPSLPWVTEQSLGLVQILERDRPGSTFVVHPHRDLAESERERLERELAAWQIPSLARLAGTWIGNLPAGIFFGWSLTGPGGRPYSPFAGSSLRLCDLVDGLLYLGPLASYTWSEPDYRPVDEADRAELRRRVELWGDPRLVERLATFDD
jgi:hypothetical protein